MKRTIIICVDDGFVQEVHTDLPEDIEVEVRLMDKDGERFNPGGLDSPGYAKCKTLLQKGGMRSIYEQ